ncbi:hypothetical protein QFZ70_002659 [Arthrobacter sp. V1I9]|uniref:DUF6308 family protein n=1 Tax=Arthrobacter sp. V1I9 TaxID=3042275 RepID=UPI002795073D|nr:DUF6308 family protein [Arthrobacter sp. V1I9]MDQ0870186.1 hypothetical protein [Arthrobacter sp. V1I9]
MTEERAASGIVSAFAAIPDETALNYLRKYYGLGAWEGRAYTGSHFDRLPATVADRVTADDIVAVACLSIHVPATASVRVLGEQADAIAALLADVPTTDLEDIPFEDHDKFFGEGTAAIALWRMLRNHKGVGQTTASKLMARKRPGVFPIFDSVVGRVTGFPNADGTWRAWHQALSGDAALTDGLRILQKSAGLERISLLRILDVVLWMHGTSGIPEQERVDGESGA